MTAADETDLFAVLGLPRRYAIVPEELERRFHERSRAVHPDRFARGTPAERRAALERTTRLNHAHRTLRDPWRRAAHLLALIAREGEDAPATADPAFLEEQLTVREELASARSRHDRDAVARIRTRATEALSVLEREVARALGDTTPTAEATRRVRRALDQARYHQALLDESERALDPRVRPRTTS